jgi:hypothetical protein
MTTIAMRTRDGRTEPAKSLGYSRTGHELLMTTGAGVSSFSSSPLYLANDMEHTSSLITKDGFGFNSFFTDDAVSVTDHSLPIGWRT